MNSSADVLQLSFNIRCIGTNFDTFNCFTNLENKKNDILLSLSESGVNDNNKNLCPIEGYDAFRNVRCDGHRDPVKYLFSYTTRNFPEFAFIKNVRNIVLKGQICSQHCV